MCRLNPCRPQKTLLGIAPCNFYAQESAWLALEARLTRLQQGVVDGLLKAYRHRDTNVRTYHLRLLTVIVTLPAACAGAVLPALRHGARGLAV